MKAAIVGLGRMGRRRANALLAQGIVPMVHDADMAPVYVEADKIRPVATLDDLWEHRPDAIFICTPPDSHSGHMRTAYDAGVRAIFVEKPLALSVPESNYDDAITMVGCNLRYHPSAATLKRWLPKIGRVRSAYLRAAYYLPDTRADYRTCYAATTGATLDVGSHMLDLALDWLGPARLVSATVKPAIAIGLPDVDGSATLRLRHADALSHVAVDFTRPGYQQTASVYGTGGCVRYSWEKRRAELDTEHERDSVTWDDSATEAMYVAETQHFLNCVRQGTPTCNPISRAAKTLALLLEARNSGRSSANVADDDTGGKSNA